MSENTDTIRFLLQAEELIQKALVVLTPRFVGDPREFVLRRVIKELVSVREHMISGRDPIREMLEQEQLLKEMMEMPLAPFYVKVLPFDDNPTAQSEE